MKATIVAGLVSLATIIGLWLGLHSARSDTAEPVLTKPTQYFLEVIVSKAEDPNQNVLMAWRDDGASKPHLFATRDECEAVVNGLDFKSQVAQLLDRFEKAGIKSVVQYACVPYQDNSI
jgi:hypothetical protein